MDFQIFISYSTDDLNYVQELQRQLENTPLKVFIAEYSVVAGEKLASNISGSIQKCDLFVVFWSHNAKNSDWVSQEIGQAKALNKKILPLVLSDGLSLPGFISDLKYIPLFNDVEKGLTNAISIATSEYKEKLNRERSLADQKQKSKENLVKIGFGAILLWALSQK